MICSTRPLHLLKLVHQRLIETNIRCINMKAKTVKTESKLMNKFIKYLNAINATYEIKLASGERLSSQREASGKTSGYVSYPRGVVYKHYAKYFNELKPGQYTEIPAGNLHLDSIARHLSSMAVFKWGKGSVMTARNKKRNVLEVMRVK
jgi:hypothetical protein